MKRVVLRGIVVCVVIMTILAGGPVQAASEEKASIGMLIQKLKEAVGEENIKNILQAGGFADTGEFVTCSDAALLLNLADETVNGKTFDEKMYLEVKKKKRLTGIGELSEARKDAAIKCFIKGIIIGESNGKYSQSRKFKAGAYISQKEMKKMITRLQNKKKRVKLSPDGQIIRKTNLPKNYKSFPYILASFPNEFYEKRFVYQDTKYNYKPVNLVDYASPKNFPKVSGEGLHGTINMGEEFDKYGALWCDLVKKNLEYRLNFDYRTVDQQWISGLRDTYYVYKDASLNKSTTDRIKRYVKAAKKNHVVVKSDKIVVEPSTMYYELGAGNYVRCYIRFKVNADKIYSAESFKQHYLIFSDWEGICFYNLKSNDWYECYCDISIDNQWGDNSEDYKIRWDLLWKK